MKHWITVIRFSLGSALLASALIIGLVGLSSASNVSFADDDEYQEERNRPRTSGNANMPDPSPGTSTADAMLYQSECGSCHLAYPAKMLPSYSWLEIMNTLDDHFGEDATVDDATKANVLAYLSAHSASRHSRYMRSLGFNDTPIRITELPYFTRKHREVPERMVSGNPDVGSFTQCDACHKDAAQGKFDEDTVVIPGFGRWDD
jgi:hypothetical protein